MAIQKLPIDEKIPPILKSLSENPFLVLQAPPGTGKTTRVPPALLQAPWLSPEKQIIVLQPRRLAAKMAALRVSDELGEGVGARVGYQFRLEQALSAKTRILFVTEGVLLRKMLSDPKLSHVGAVILDEFHERSLQADLALALLNRLQKSSRADLRIVVMSATLDTQGIQEYLSRNTVAPCPVIQTKLRDFEVKIESLSKPLTGPLELGVKRAVTETLGRKGSEPGDILVFLPGMSEILAAARALESDSNELLICPLYGDLSKQEQLRAVTRAKQRKVVLATNIAETSLTIEGIDTVIDCGLAKKASHSNWSGLPVLTTRPISKASAIQRAGRAGRLGPGTCIRLYTHGDFQGRAPFEVPEIHRADLTQAVLELKVMGIRDLETFDWYEAPPQSSLEAAQTLLWQLGALDRSGEVTSLGRKMADLPLHPRISRILLDASKQGVESDGAWLAALLSEGRTRRVDLSELFDPARSRSRNRPPEFQDRRLQKIQSRLLKMVSGTRREGAAFPEAAFPDVLDRLGRALLKGYPDRVAQKKVKSHEKGELLFAFMSGAAQLPAEFQADPSEFYIALEIDEQQRLRQGRGRLQIRSLWPIDPDWLLELESDSFGIEEQEQLAWNTQSRRVESLWQMRYGQLILNETRGSPRDALGAAKLLSSQVTHWGQICDREELESWLNRIEFLRINDQIEWESALDFEENREGFLRGQLEKFAEGKLSFRELVEGEFLSFLHFSLEESTRQKLERLAPERVQLTGGRRVKVHYERDRAPWIESRLQDFFGMRTGPSLLGGTYRLALHLLAPNQRAVQITTDLSGFWERDYPRLRRELGRRYPRHKWPENPLA